MFARPVGEPRCSCGWRIHAEQIAHQALDLFARDEHIALQAADERADDVTEPRRHTDNRSARADDVANRADEFAVREGLGTDRVDDTILARFALCNRERGEVVHEDRLQAIRAIAKDAKDRQMPQRPGDVVARISSAPKRTVGRRIAYDKPDSTSARSSFALPLKYSSGESSDGFVMLT